MFIQEFYSNIQGIDTSVPRFATTFRGTRIIITSDLISEVLHVPQVAHLDYLGCKCLRIVSKYELLSHFCETPFIWGGKQNTLCSGFAKGPRFLNMVMTFTFTPLSHYNSITDPRACFLLSFLEDLSIDFPSYFITSILNVYQNTTTYDKLIFPSAITRILRPFFHPYSWFSLLHHYGCHWCRFCSTKQGLASTEAATCGVYRSCNFYSFFLLVMWPWRPSWHSFSAWMLALTLSLMNCLRWTPMSIV